MNQVKVISENGVVVRTNPKNPDAHFFIVEEVAGLSFNAQGFLNKFKRVAIPVGKNDLTFAQANVKDGLVLNGKIQVTESHTPFYTGQTAKMNPNTKVLVLSNGQPVYQQRRFTTDVNAIDVLLATDRVGVSQSGATAEQMLAARLVGA